MSILPSEISTFQYYVKKCPLYLQNDECFLEHFRIWFDFLMGNVTTGLVPTADTLLSLINPFDDNYLSIINSLEDVGSDMLDKLASIFNISRNFSVTIDETSYAMHLDNADFLLFIKAQIIKNYSDGTYVQMREFYDKAGLLIYFVTDISATTRAYLLEIGGSEYSYSDEIQTLFLAGLLTIESVGINYSYSIQNYNKMLVWDKEIEGDYTGWDYGEWVL